MPELTLTPMEGHTAPGPQSVSGPYTAGTPQQPTTPEQDDVGILGAGAAGLRQNFSEFQQGAQTAMGQQPQAEQEHWYQQPVEMNDFWPSNLHTRLLPKLSYGLANSMPELAGGIGGGALGAAALSETGPGAGLGGILGGALGAGAINIMHKIGPFYAAELKNDPHDPSAAFDRAWQQAKLNGALTGTSWAVFGGLNPFKSAVKNLALQTFVAQPAVSVAGTAAREGLAGRTPTPEELTSAYGQGVVGTLPVWAGHAVTHAILRGGAEATAEGEKPLHQKLHEAVEDLYGQADSGGPINPDYVRGVVIPGIKQQLIKAGGDPYVDTNIFGPVDRLAEGRSQFGGLDLADIGTKRSNLSSIERSADVSGREGAAREANLAGIARRGIDQFHRSPEQLQAAGMPEDQAHAVANAANIAAGLRHDLGDLDRFHELQNKVERGNPKIPLGQRWQSEANAIMKSNKRYAYSDEMQSFLDHISERGTGGLFERIASNLDPATFKGMLYNYFLSTIHLGAGALGATLGWLSKRIEKGRFADVTQKAEAIPQQIQLRAAARSLRPELLPQPKPAPRVYPQTIRPLPPQFAQPTEPDRKLVPMLGHHKIGGRALAIAHRMAQQRG